MTPASQLVREEVERGAEEESAEGAASESDGQDGDADDEKSLDDIIEAYAG